MEKKNQVIKREAPKDLFVFEGPEDMVEVATRVSKTLSDVIEQAKLYVPIQGKKYVTVEGWTTLGFMVGVYAVVEETKRTVREPHSGRKKPEIIWEARATARRKDGEIIGAAEMLCSSYERNWANRDEYAIKSMAETRAVSKALRMPLGWIISLAGYSPTPAEETDTIRAGQNGPSRPEPQPGPSGGWSHPSQAEPSQGGGMGLIVDEDEDDDGDGGLVPERVEDPLTDEEIQALISRKSTFKGLVDMARREGDVTRTGILDAMKRKALSAKYAEELTGILDDVLGE